MSSTFAPIVDGISGDMSIANFWRSKFEQLLNTSRIHDAGLLLDELDHLITSDSVHEVVISAEVVCESVNRLKRGKSDGESLLSGSSNASFVSCKILLLLSFAMVTFLVHSGMLLFCQFQKLTNVHQTPPITVVLTWHHVSVKCWSGVLF